MTSNVRSVFSGQCHCGAIGFVYRIDKAPSDWSIRACQCSFCRAHDALSTSDPHASIEFHSQDSDLLQRYRFGLRTADFLLCRKCGVYLGAVIDTDKGQFGIINVHTLDRKPDHLAGNTPISYDEEAVGDRIARREERWARVVAVPWQINPTTRTIP